MAYTVSTGYITYTTGTSTSTHTGWEITTTGTTNGVDFNFAGVYDPMETCMWCGESVPRSQVDEHEDGCGE